MLYLAIHQPGLDSTCYCLLTPRCHYELRAQRNLQSHSQRGFTFPYRQELELMRGSACGETLADRLKRSRSWESCKPCLLTPRCPYELRAQRRLQSHRQQGFIVPPWHKLGVLQARPPHSQMSL